MIKTEDFVVENKPRVNILKELDKHVNAFNKENHSKTISIQMLSFNRFFIVYDVTVCKNRLKK